MHTIGILTSSRTNNIGTDLQALAMQWLFTSENVQAELIGYQCRKLENSRRFFYPHNLRGLLNLPYRIVKHHLHESFRKKYFHYSPQQYDEHTIAQNTYPTLVVGSDQIWNLDVVGGDLSFFLPYSNTKQEKYAYAPSMGKTDLTLWEQKYHLAEKLRDFREVTVREQSGVEALKALGISAGFALDPLLMHSSDKWLEIAEPIEQTKPYVFVYCVDREKEAIQLARKYAAEHGLEVIVYGRHLKRVRGVKVVQLSTIGQWLTYMNQAALVITNSYHGLSFAIRFHKAFSIFRLRNEESYTRLENLLSITGLGAYPEGQIIEPDWNTVDQNLNQSQVQSKKYIERVMSRYDRKNETSIS